MMLIILKTSGLNIPFLLATGSPPGNSLGIASTVSLGRVSLASAFVSPNGARSSACKSFFQMDLTNL